MVVTRLLPTRKKLMITAAVRSSFWALRMRPRGRSGSSWGSPRSSGITATPVSKPESPSASLGNSSTATASMRHGLPWVTNSACFHCASAWG